MKSYHFQKGISLVETLVAIGIMSLLLLAAISLMTGMSKGEKRSKVMSEVEWNASFILSDITQSLRNASAISLPGAGVVASSTALVLSGIPSQNPTVYSVESGVLYVSRGGGPLARLSSPLVTVSNMSFHNISPVGIKGAMRVGITITHANPGNRPELVYSTTRTTTVTLR